MVIKLDQQPRTASAGPLSVQPSAHTAAPTTVLDTGSLDQKPTHSLTLNEIKWQGSISVTLHARLLKSVPVVAAAMLFSLLDNKYSDDDCSHPR